MASSPSSEAGSSAHSSTFERLQSLSRRAAAISALGAAITIGALLYSGYELSRAEERRSAILRELKAKQEEVEVKQGQLVSLEAKLRSTQRSFENSRCALDETRIAIEAFHNRDYATAIQHYEKAGECDPDNPYVLNLEAYSMFKSGRVDDAIKIQSLSIRADPNYAWGYFDLARFLCSAKRFDAAKQAKTQAIELRPSLNEIMRADGEFTHLCRPILD